MHNEKEPSGRSLCIAQLDDLIRMEAHSTCDIVKEIYMERINILQNTLQKMRVRYDRE